MRAGFAFTMALVLTATLTGSATAQVIASAEGGVQVVLQPLDATAPALAVTDPTIAPGRFGVLGLEFGFYYVRPDWSDDRFTQLLPPGVANAFPQIGDINDLDQEFVFAPRIALNYLIDDQALGVSASGYLINLSGDISRTLTLNGAAGNVGAASEIEIIAANLIEGTLRKDLHESRLLDLLEACCPCLDALDLEETVIIYSLGFRYSTLRQRYKATLASAPINATLESKQEFSGVGLTGSVQTFYPMDNGFSLYSNTRGSLLIGTNHKHSFYSLTVAANPALGQQGDVDETKRDLVPVGEVEVGVMWHRELANERGAAVSGPLLWVQAGLVGQVWGGAGMLSALENPQRFDDDELFLYGVSIVVGIER